MKKYFIIALAALGFAACAEKISDGPSPEQTGELEQSYIAINLMSSELDTRVNTDAPVLEDGEAAERKVNSVHFFFFRQGVPFAVNAAGSAPGGDRNWLYATTPSFTEDLDKDNISAYSNVMLVLNNYKGQYPDQIVAVINWTPDNDVYKLDELHAKLVGLQGNDGGFVMSNSVYKSGENVIDATAISGTYKTAAEAESNPVAIYVERVAAKVKVSTPASTIEGKWDATNKWFDTGKTSNLTTLGESQNKVYVKIQNWSLYNARTQSTLLKSIDPTWTDDALGLTWNDSPRFRSYWADAKEYSSTYINDNTFNWTYGNPLEGSEYCGENTASQEENRTKLILKGQLVDANSNALELVKWNGQEMVKVENLKMAVAAQLQYLVYSYTYTNKEDKATYTYSPITFEDIECISGANEGAPENVKNYQVFFQLKTGLDKSWAVKSGDEWDYKDASQLNSYLSVNIPPATVYADGQTYYYVDIKHLGTSGKTAEYGIVRNHIYDIEIQSIKGYGTPVFIPGGNIVVPETPTEEEGVYVAAKINVLSWRVVKQGVNIDVN
ncbi:MAG: Mfa1 family fimbria major subunit [Bacteroidales bacterium]|nr:Mfa1 family fimbria major subunit [Bacteroidales bacterium]